jgi:ElaB/YqjD/DUF883 family membrane-anchored ribosome-binding protein
MPNKTTQGSNPGAADVRTAASDITERARNAVSSMTDAAGDAAAALDEKRSTAADGLDTAASALHDRADHLPGGETVRNVARATADRLSTGADYVRSHDAKHMMADVESFVKSNPGPALAIAAAFGFVLGRALSRD